MVPRERALIRSRKNRSVSEMETVRVTRIVKSLLSCFLKCNLQRESQKCLEQEAPRRKEALFVCLWYRRQNPGPSAHARKLLSCIPSSPFIMRQEFAEWFTLALNL